MFAPPPKKEIRVQPGYRVRDSLAKYIESRTAKTDDGEPAYGEVTRVLEETIEHHRRLLELLAPHEAELKKAAAAEGLEWPRQFTELIAVLTKRSLKKK